MKNLIKYLHSTPTIKATNEHDRDYQPNSEEMNDKSGKYIKSCQYNVPYF